MKRTGVVGTLLLALLLLVGCDPGQSRARLLDMPRTGLDSVDGRVGQLRLLSVSIASPGARGSTHLAGSSAALLLTLAHDGRPDDRLTGVSTEVAHRVVLRDGDAAADPHLQVDVPAGGVAELREVSGRHLELSGLRETLRSGFSIPVTFSFRDAGPVTLRVPVRTYTDVPVDRVPPPLAADGPIG